MAGIAGMPRLSADQGLNGRTVIYGQHVQVGRVAGVHYGYKRPLVVSFDVRIERLTRQDVYETVDHRMVSEPLSFAITSDVWRPDGLDIVSAGAGTARLLNLASYSNGFDAATVAGIIDLGQWHLNHMTAGCSHQNAPEGSGIVELLEHVQPCPFTGYRYGHAWLVRELPCDFLSNVARLLSHAADRSRFFDPEGLLS